ncbi:tetratricopeptide repeat protein [Pokkaliibacter sp. CJK22405]|uniref:tetratricopeptide repeat protein n=1 Tax=Pokkaliibacter sp. CJK22405 TaxID=3384615 RepID=UPI003984D345
MAITYGQQGNWARAFQVVLLTSVMAGCASVQTGQVPVEDASTSMGTQPNRTVTPVQEQSQAMSTPLDTSSGISGSVSTGVSGSVTDGSGTMGNSSMDSGSMNSGSMSSSGMSGSVSSGSSMATTTGRQSTPAVVALLDQSSSMAGSGQLNAAISRAERALRLDSRDPNIYLQLMNLYQRAGNAQQARAMATRGLAVSTTASERQAFQAYLNQ